MLKLVGFLLGVAGGAAGTAAWLLSEPDGANSATMAASPADRVSELKARFQVALEEGHRAGAETENRIRHEFESYRRHPDRPATSS